MGSSPTDYGVGNGVEVARMVAQALGAGCYVNLKTRDDGRLVLILRRGQDELTVTGEARIVALMADCWLHEMLDIEDEREG